MEDVDPVQNTDSLAGVEQKDLSFPFVVTEEDHDRMAVDSTANDG